MAKTQIEKLQKGIYITVTAFIISIIFSFPKFDTAFKVTIDHQYLKYGMYNLMMNSFKSFADSQIIMTILVILLMYIVQFILRGRLNNTIVYRTVKKIFDYLSVYKGFKIVSCIIFCAFISLMILKALMMISYIKDNSGRPNVIFIGVDTLRADHLGCYGYRRKTSRNIDAWAKNATLFENCIASIPRTTQSLASILTAKYPYAIGVRNLKDKLLKQELSVTEILKNAKYQTRGVIATGIPYRKIDQGFDRLIEAKPLKEFSAQKTTDYAIELINKTNKEYFLFVFYRDPHMSYSPPREIFDKTYKGRFKRSLKYYPNKANCVFRNSFDDRLRKHAIALYDSEIHYTDQEIGRLLQSIKRKSNNNIIVFFSDHGESLGEHDFYYDHGDYLYQPSLHIPLIIEGISFKKNRVKNIVRSIDIVPTVLSALDIHVANNEFTGVDLTQMPNNLEAYSETGRVQIDAAFKTKRRFIPGIRGRLRSLVMNHKKLILIPKEKSIEYEYYDLREDPQEVNNEAGTANINQMKKKLFTWMRKDESNWSLPEKAFSTKELDSLRSLGYL